MRLKTITLFLAVALLPMISDAKGYSSGGRSYSSARSSSSFSRSSGSGSSSRSSGFSKSYTSGSGRTYSSGSSSTRPSPSGSSRTYSAGSSRDKSYSSPAPAPKPTPSSSGTSPRKQNSSSASDPSFSFDKTAARAQKEAASQRDFSAWKQNQSSQSSRRSSSEVGSSPPVIARSSNGGRSYSASSGDRPVFTPDPQSYRTRAVRVEHHYAPYYTRPMVVYRDNYNSFFWWWLLDRTLDDRASWAYHHRADMDSARYQALLGTDANLEARVRQLESQQTPVNPNYVPSGMDRDLMYSDQYVHRAYATRSTTSGRVFFWLILVPTAIGTVWFLSWLIFYKRWHTART